jgi:hypothetical protein
MMNEKRGGCKAIAGQANSENRRGELAQRRGDAEKRVIQYFSLLGVSASLHEIFHFCFFIHFPEFLSS